MKGLLCLHVPLFQMRKPRLKCSKSSMIFAKRAVLILSITFGALAHDPQQLKAIWGELKSIMGPGEIDPLTKEMIYIAVSVANGCSYCIHSHTAAAKAKGMSEAQHNELVSIIGMAGKTNHLVTALQVPVDDAFKV